MAPGLDAGERAELERLRRELAGARAAPGRTRAPVRWRSLIAGVLIVLGCALAPVALVAVWVDNQISDTDTFVTTVSPLARDEAVQAAVTDRVTTEIFTRVDIKALADQALDALENQGLPPVITNRLHGFTGSLDSAVEGFIHDRIGELVASPQFAAAWDQTVRLTHQQAIAALSGNSSAITTEGGTAQLDLAVFINLAKERLVAAGFEAASLVPDAHPTIELMDARTLIRAQNAYQLLHSVAGWLPWAVLVTLALGGYLARDHRRAVLGIGLGVALSMLVLAVGLLAARAFVVGAAPATAVAAATASFDILVRFLRTGLRTVTVLGLVIAAGAFLFGPSTTATRTRAGLSRMMGTLRSGGAAIGLRTGPVGRWVHANLRVLRIGALALAVLVFVFVDQPSGATVLVIAGLLVVALGLIEFLNLPGPARPDARGAEAAGQFLNLPGPARSDAREANAPEVPAGTERARPAH
ncbi:MAG: hypothetical protein ACJ72N_06205 [Labedaea sp.]